MFCTEAFSLQVYEIMVLSFTLLLIGFSLFSGLIPNVSGSYSDQRFLLCILSWFVVCFCLYRITSRRYPVANPKWLPFFIPLVLVFLSGELYPTTYHVEPLMFAFFFLGSCLFGDYLASKRNLDLIVTRCLSAVSLLVLFYGFIALMNYSFAVADGILEIDTKIIWGFPNIRYWSHLATWLIPLLALAQCSASLSSLPIVRGLFALSGCFCWWILISTSARGSALGLLVGVFVVVVLFRRFSVDWGASLWLVLTVLFPFLIFGAVELRGVETDSAGRIPLWQEAWEMSLVNFPFGLGPQSWLTHPTMTEAYADSKSYAHPHNMYLLWASEYGWVSVAGLLILVSGIIKSLIHRCSDCTVGGRELTVMAGFTASIVAAGVHSAFSAVLMAPASMLTGFVVLSLFLGLLGAPSQERLHSSRALPHSLVRVLAGGTLLVSLVVGPVWIHETWRYYKDNMEDRVTYKGQGSIYSPRFWSHGDFPRQ